MTSRNQLWVGAGLALFVSACGNAASADADGGRDSAARNGIVPAAASGKAATQQGVADPFTGTWKGQLEGDGTAIISHGADGYSVTLEVATSPPPGSGFLPCMGGIEGNARLQGERLVLTRSADGATCRVVMRRNGSSLAVEEAGPECFSYHGISCGFSGTLQRSDAPSSDRPPGVPTEGRQQTHGPDIQPRSGNAEVEVAIAAGDGQMENCALGEVAGLAPRGDGFLAVRAGPGTGSRELNRLYNGQKVLLCDGRGDWRGIVYPADSPACGTEGAGPERAYGGPCRSGWVHGRWVKVLAG